MKQEQYNHSATTVPEMLRLSQKQLRRLNDEFLELVKFDGKKSERLLKCLNWLGVDLTDEQLYKLHLISNIYVARRMIAFSLQNK